MIAEDEETLSLMECKELAQDLECEILARATQRGAQQGDARTRSPVLRAKSAVYSDVAGIE